ncbi:hypothetical protein ACOSQ2_015535 [Xanthoceras sorbifolium]
MDSEELARMCAKLSLTDADGPMAKIDKAIRESGRRRVSLCLFGKIFANKEVNRIAFKGAIARIWRTVKDFEVESVGMNLFVFQFKCPWDRKRVLDGGPWNFDKNLIVLREASGVDRVSDIDFNLIPFWVQLHNLPLACMCKEVMIGDPDEVCSVVLCYERLSNFCYFYGKIGHHVRECSDNTQGILDEESLRFGAWMRALAPFGGRPRKGN